MHEQDGDNEPAEPAHHARRPMNAFLIFCKRHRSVVREKYPNLENRSITKILGEWWANLEEEDKATYTELAKKYKDAFFDANPDFKWYKLPAPPLRTLSSRPPREVHDKHIEHNDHEYEKPEKINNNSTVYDYNAKKDHYYDEGHKTHSMFTPGKLADEAHMGGLSSLLATKTEPRTHNPYYSPPTFKGDTISKRQEKDVDSIRELQNELSETTKLFENFDERKMDARYKMADLPNQGAVDQVVDKRYFQEEWGYQKNWSDEDKNSKSKRSCKGKRYQEFMAVGGLIGGKRHKRDQYDKSLDDGYTNSWDEASCKSEGGTSTDEGKNIPQEMTVKDEIKTEHDEQDESSNKTYTAANFGLDAKIRALPPLSLEEFQQKKRDNKRKKKTNNFKVKSNEKTQTNTNNFLKYITEDRKHFAVSGHENVTGSQKRKPRKISITHFEINSIVSNSGFNKNNNVSPEIKFATEAPNTIQPIMDECKQPVHNNRDLFALATLAEVAASRLEETAIFDNMAPNATDSEASMV